MVQEGVLKKKKGEPAWVGYAKQRTHKWDQNLNIAITGPVGSGKSFTSLAIAEMIDPSFDIKRVCFSASEVITLIRTEKLPKGSVILFEEVGVNQSSREWQSKQNRNYNYMFQTFRFKNYIFIMNSPLLDFVDVQTRRLIHCEFKTCSIDRKRNKVKIKPLFISWNSYYRKFFNRYLRVRTATGVKKVERWCVPKPSLKLLRGYKKRKQEFFDQLMNKIDESFEEDSQSVHTKLLTPKQLHVFEMISAGKSLPEMAETLGIKSDSVLNRIWGIEKKGYAFKRKNNIFTIVKKPKEA